MHHIRVAWVCSLPIGHMKDEKADLQKEMEQIRDTLADEGMFTFHGEAFVEPRMIELRRRGQELRAALYKE